MIDLRTLGLTLLTMIAFAGNSILCRLALRETSAPPLAAIIGVAIGDSASLSCRTCFGISDFT